MHLFQVGQGTVQRIVIQVAKALNKHFSSTVTFPTGEMREKVEKDFFNLCGIPGKNQYKSWNAWFHDCSSLSGIVGIIDGSHIKIQRPRKRDLGNLHPDLFYGRKGFFSLNILAIVDAQLRITYLNSL